MSLMDSVLASWGSILQPAATGPVQHWGSCWSSPRNRSSVSPAATTLLCKPSANRQGLYCKGTKSEPNRDLSQRSVTFYILTEGFWTLELPGTAGVCRVCVPFECGRETASPGSVALQPGQGLEGSACCPVPGELGRLRCCAGHL